MQAQRKQSSGSYKGECVYAKDDRSESQMQTLKISAPLCNMRRRVV